MIFLNQKMNLTKLELKEFIDNLEEHKTILFPTMPLLSYASEIYENIGSQDVSEFLEGAYTGQTSVKTLKSLNVKYCLIGHSEKRTYLNEDKMKIISKIELCQKHDISPILIIGETLEEYQQGKTYQVLKKQLIEIFDNLNCDLKNIVIAYEPIWSINNHVPNKLFIEQAITFIKTIISVNYGETLKVIYGGGIDERNISDLKTISNLDGLLIGRASLDYQKINEIYRKYKN